MEMDKFQVYDVWNQLFENIEHEILQKLDQLQNLIDLKKWYESEAHGHDMCGAYDFCAFCDKSVSLPCATAYRKAAQNATKELKKSVEKIEKVEEKTEESIQIEEPVKKIKKEKAASTYVPKRKAAVRPAQPQDTSLGKKFDFDKVMAKKASRKSLTFAEKYALSSDIIKARYAILQNALTDTPKGAPKIKSRISKQCDTYRREGEIIAKVTIIGTSLRINLPLDCDAPEFNDGKTPHVFTGHKKVYEEVPFQFKVNSKLGLKRALALIELIK